MVSMALVHKLLKFEVLVCFAALWAITTKKQWRAYWALGSYLGVRVLAGSASLYCFHVAGHRLTANAAYIDYFWVYWISFAVESVIALLIIYSVFRLAMAPLKGLQRLGTLIFRWAATISVALALGTTLAAHVSGTNYFFIAISQFQRTQSILTICLLLFVCFAIRPMGLSYRSRIFGVSLGLGIMATNDLAQSAWLNKPGMHTLRDLINGLVISIVAALWTAYFALPEPKRRIIVLPTTSPFLRWNQISQALGDSPGFVAIGGVPPEIFAPAEVEIMRRASLKMVTEFPKSVGA